ncbi:hypothetical protein [uncultured Curtobacterium sp.]|uniref:hypothetical protein n=1 Tax=uncultured Curtobacterium sp. TaxID=331964 RepID=UPI00258CA467|nr:hypothetical protein [uncultured Curtobacterium sp.]
MNKLRRPLSRPSKCLLAAAIFVGVLGGAELIDPPPRAAAATQGEWAHPAAEAITPKRWSYVWQRWDGTNYSSQATCLARGRAVLKHYPDVQSISCRKPCGRWWLYTYRQQWV